MFVFVSGLCLCAYNRERVERAKEKKGAML